MEETYRFPTKKLISCPMSFLSCTGKLKFKATNKGTITTPYVIVEGELYMRAKADLIGPVNENINFVLTGTDNVEFKPSEAPNTESCPANNGHVCNLGAKPFVVAGGKLDIVGFYKKNCATHTPVLDKLYRDVAPNETAFEKFRSFPPTCQHNSSATDFFSFDFDSGFGNWTGNVSSSNIYIYHECIAHSGGEISYYTCTNRGVPFFYCSTELF